LFNLPIQLVDSFNWSTNRAATIISHGAWEPACHDLPDGLCLQ
jgi:hypothetical protein